jgi:hypothetical protein
MLPPLYFANPISTPLLPTPTRDPNHKPNNNNYKHTTKSLSPCTRDCLTRRLEAIHKTLGPRKPGSAVQATEISRLRRELEGGMCRERRRLVEGYVRGIADPWKRAATEVYLAQYAGFVIRGDGYLDFGTGGWEMENEKKREGNGGRKRVWGDWGGLGECVLM